MLSVFADHEHEAATTGARELKCGDVWPGTFDELSNCWWIGTAIQRLVELPTALDGSGEGG